MTRVLVISIIALFTLSQCGDGTNAGAPKEKVIYVDSNKKPAKKKAKKEGTPSSMSKEQVAKAREILSTVSKKEVAAVNAKKIFKVNCASCHGFTGNLGVNGAKDLTVSTVSMTEAVAQVYHGKGLMTPYKGVLSDVELVAVAKYTESLRKKK